MTEKRIENKQMEVELFEGRLRDNPMPTKTISDEWGEDFE